jgi:hypothetical protein
MDSIRVYPYLRESAQREVILEWIQELSDFCEEAGFEVPPGTSIEDLLAAEDEILSGLEESFGGRVKAAFGKVKAAFKHKSPVHKAPQRPQHVYTPTHSKPKMWKAGRSREIARNM